MDIATTQQLLPAVLRQVIGDSDWHQEGDGESDATVFRLVGDTTRFLKISSVDAQFPVSRDRQKLEWLQGKIAVPQILAYTETTTCQYLLMSEIEGTYPFHDDLDWTPEERIICLASAAKAFHSIPIKGCPFKWGIKEQLAQVRENIGLDRIAVDDWEEEHKSKTIDQLHKELRAARPDSEDLVVVHGDMYPLNIHADPDTKQVNGYIDVGACGVGDRFTDLAVMVQAINWHFGQAYIDFFFQQYGIPIDEQKVRFYQLMVEFY